MQWKTPQENCALLFQVRLVHGRLKGTEKRHLYVSCLTQRVHLVISVVTLTSAGVLCYAGHVCNYYVKVLEWVRGFPAVLRDKHWFLIKRRKSILLPSGDNRQKEPITANRRRLEVGMAEAKMFLPSVYKDSVLMPEELNMFPYEGEVEMLEQADTVDLNGEVHIDMDMLSAWLSVSETSEDLYPCARALARDAMDQQGVDMRVSCFRHCLGAMLSRSFIAD